MDNQNQNDNHDRRAELSFVALAFRKSIRNRILVLTVSVCLFSLLSMSVASYVTIWRASDYSLEANAAFAKGAADSAADALTDQAYQLLQVVAKEQAASCDRLLESIKFDMDLLAGIVNGIFAHPDHYIAQPPNPGGAQLGQSGEYYIVKNADYPEKLEREAMLLDHSARLLPSLRNNDSVLKLYVGMESGLLYSYLPTVYDNPDYDHRQRPWYIAAAEQPGQTILSDIYEDAFGAGMVLTAARAIQDINGALIGVAAMDISMQDLNELVLGTRIIGSSRTLIIDSGGNYVVRPDLIAGATLSGRLGELIDKSGGFAPGDMSAKSGETDFAVANTEDGRMFLVFAPMSATDWSLGVLVGEADILGALDVLSGEMISLAEAFRSGIASMSAQAAVFFVLIFFVVMAMVAFVSVRLTDIISKPIQKLATDVTKIGAGSFEYRIPVESQDEIGLLTKVFNDMADSLYNYAQDIVLLNQKKSMLELISYTDGLTGILNRRSFLEMAEKHTELTLTGGKSVYIVMFDLDFFKSVNDKYGHLAGDEVLRCISKRVSELIRSDDIFARYGGEEFVLVFSDITKENVLRLVERIRVRICKEPVVYEGGEIYISASFGVASVNIEQGFFAAVASADKALYAAKENGRNNAVFADADKMQADYATGARH